MKIHKNLFFCEILKRVQNDGRTGAPFPVAKKKPSCMNKKAGCREPESNWHVDCSTQDFKSWASTNSAIPASGTYIIQKAGNFQVGDSSG